VRWAVLPAQSRKVLNPLPTMKIRCVSSAFGSLVSSAILAAFLTLLGPANSSGATLVGCSWYDGKLYGLNTATGAATFLVDTNVGTLSGIAFQPDTGVLFGVELNTHSLVTINPVTGMKTIVKQEGLNVGGPATFIQGALAFDPSGDALYSGVIRRGTSLSMISIDPVSGIGTFTSGTLGKFFSDVAFDRAGTLYAIGLSNLLTIDPSTGTLLDEISLNRPLGEVAGLAFDPETNIAYVVDGNLTDPTTGRALFTLDTSSGVLTPVGNMGLPGVTYLSGLAFTPGIVPEPTIVALLGLPALAMVARRRRTGSLTGFSIRH
jgi:Repeat of unknown function (DUF6923)